MIKLSFETIYYIDLPMCILSAIANLLIFVAYIYFKDLRNYSFRLIFYLAISELMTSTAFMIPYWTSDPGCYAQASILNFSCLSSVLWTSVYAFTLYRSLALEKRDGWKYEMYYLLYAFGIPLVLEIIPIAFEGFTEAEGWCWIKVRESHESAWIVINLNIWRVITFLAPTWIVIVFNIVMYWKLIKIINRIIENVEDGQIAMHHLYNRLKLYPFMLLVCHIPVTVHRIIEFFVDEHENAKDSSEKDNQVWLTSLLASFFLILSGFLNAVVYGLTDRVKEELQKLMYQTSSDSSDYSILSASESEGNARGSTNTI